MTTATATLQIDYWRGLLLKDALKDSLRTWENMRYDALTGNRPGMDPEGARLMIEDLKNLLAQVKDQIKD